MTCYFALVVLLGEKPLTRALFQPRVVDAARSKLNLAKLICARDNSGHFCALTTTCLLGAWLGVIAGIICLVSQSCRRLFGLRSSDDAARSIQF